MIEAEFDMSEFTEDELAEILKRVEDEKLKILHRRDLIQKRHIGHLNNVALLQIAADYLEWLYTSGRGNTFSTFVNEFGYDSMLARAVFGQIGNIYNEMEKMAFPGDALFSDVDYHKPPYVVEKGDD
ncbi:hypothetical protein [Methylomonas fluvii]|nr:hypothetical protein [Methylomonas fluvii]